jgi:hypothetical protein
VAVLALEAVAQIAHMVVGRLHTHVLLLDDMVARSTAVACRNPDGQV